MTAKKDFTQVAHSVMLQATGAIPKIAAPKQKAAGKAVGGAKRMADMTAEQRKELALKAAGARWSKTAPGPDGTGAGKVSKGG
jgi:hypothetical protein